MEHVKLPGSLPGSGKTGQLNAAIEWASRAAKGGVVEAQRVLAECAWWSSDYLKFLFWALPLAQEIERRCGGHSARRQICNNYELNLLVQKE